jgi:hypothetical protein
MCGGEPVETHIFRDRFFADWTTGYSALIRFSTGAVGSLLANCTSAGRLQRFEVHGRGIGAELEMPKGTGFVATVWEGRSELPQLVSGETLEGARETDATATRELHRSFVKAIETGGETLTSFDECLGTMRLVEALEGDAA